MYPVLGHPEKAAKQISVVVDSMYKVGPDGLSGNDDCGQMSAWLVWTSIGMYPMNPVSGEYVFGYPLVSEATIKLPNKKTLLIKVTRLRGNKKGINKVVLNGKTLKGSISHKQLIAGGKLDYIIWN
jgi:putative alpha-1,2-mannosidase